MGDNSNLKINLNLLKTRDSFIGQTFKGILICILRAFRVTLHHRNELPSSLTSDSSDTCLKYTASSLCL